MKKYVSGVVLGLALSLVVAQPTYAAENIFQRFANNVSMRFERLSLMLPGNKSGKAVMRQATVAMQNLKSADTTTVITADMLKADQTVANAKLTIAGPVEMNMQDPTNVKQSLNVAGEMTMQGTSVRANADLKVTKDMVYFRVNEAPVVPYVNLQALKGKWLKTANTAKDAEGQGELSADQQQKLKDAYMKLLQDSQYSTAKKETKNGKAVYVVEATIPNAALVEFVKAVMEISKANTTAQAQEQMAEQIGKLGDIKSTIWVDRGSFYVTHMDLPLSFTPERQAGARAATPTAANPLAGLEDIDKVNILVTVDMKDFNKAINFEEPADAQDAQQAFQEMMGAGAGVGGTMMAPPTRGGTSELPGLTPQQQRELEQYQKMSAEQQRMMIQIEE